MPGCAHLAGEADSGVDTGRIADWLLGQQPDARRRSHAHRGCPATARRAAGPPPRPSPARDGRLRSAGRARRGSRSRRGRRLDRGRCARLVASRRVRATPAAPRPRESPMPRSSKLGGAILIGILVVAIAGLIVFIPDEPAVTTTRRRRPDSSRKPRQRRPRRPTASASANDIVLQGTNGSQAGGHHAPDPRQQGQGPVRASPRRTSRRTRTNEVYAGPPAAASSRSASASRSPRWAATAYSPTAGPQKGDETGSLRWFATYSKVLVTRETSAKAATPGPAILQGTLPNGA